MSHDCTVHSRENLLLGRCLTTMAGRGRPHAPTFLVPPADVKSERSLRDEAWRFEELITELSTINQTVTWLAKRGLLHNGPVFAGLAVPGLPSMDTAKGLTARDGGAGRAILS